MSKRMMAPPFKNGSMLGVVNNPSTIILFKRISPRYGTKPFPARIIKPPFENDGLP
jgi:hypothetical protein